MKNIAIGVIILLGCMISRDCFSQEKTLFLDIPDSETGKIVLKIGENGNPLKQRDTMNLSGSTWLFKIKSPQGFRVEIKDLNSLNISTIHDLSKTYKIENDILTVTGTDTSFKIPDRFSLKVIRTNNTSFEYFLTYKPVSGVGLTGSSSDEASSQPTGMIYHDAKFLADPTKNWRAKRAILAFYANIESNDSLLREAYKENKFLTKYIDSIRKTASSQAGGLIQLITGMFSGGIGGLDVTNLADGLAKFLVKRAKEELNLAFFEKFKNTLADPRYKDLPTLFPQTVSVLNTIGEQVYNYDRYLQNLREAFKTDLNELNRNLPGIIDNHPVFFTRYPVAETSLRSACYITSELQNEVHPGDVLANFPLEYFDPMIERNIAHRNLRGAIQTIQLISASLRDTANSDSATYWVSLKQVRDLVNNRQFFKIYLGLIYQEAKVKYEGIRFKDTTLTFFLNMLANTYDQRFDEYDAYKKYVLRFGEKIHALNNMIKAHSKPANDSSAFELYAKYFHNAVDLIEYCTLAAELPHIKDHVPELHHTYHKYFEIAYTASNLVVDITRKNYSSAINQGVHIYDLVKANPIEYKYGRLESETKAFSDSVLSGDPGKTSAILKREVDYLNANKPRTVDTTKLKDTLKEVATIRNNSRETGKLLLKYGAFASSVAIAKNSNEIANAIEAFALPSGSARIKRVSDFNVSLNAYVGLFAGYEKIKGADEDNFEINTVGVTAPIGVTASWGHRKFYGVSKGGQWSYSLFISVIDLGAVAAFRFKDTISLSGTDTLVADKVPSIQLRDIFSPGLFLSVGIPNSPISINLGTQIGPNLRKITTLPETGNSVADFSNKMYFRFSASVCVDIPLINLYTKSQ